MLDEKTRAHPGRPRGAGAADGDGGVAAVNTDIMFSSKTDLWETPQEFFDALDEEFHFELDVCATNENAKCDCYFTREQDGLNQEWDCKVCWCNPPYGREIGKWVEKAYLTVRHWGNTVVMLLPARTDTKWFHDYIYGKAEIRFVRGRLKFGKSKNSAPFPSMIVIFRGNTRAPLLTPTQMALLGIAREPRKFEGGIMV